MFHLILFKLSHYREKIETTALSIYLRFSLSNVYIMFLIFVPDFSILINPNETLTILDSFLTLSFVVVFSFAGMIKADLESYWKMKLSIVDRFFAPYYSFHFLLQAIFALQSAVFYAIRLFKPEILHENEALVGFLQLGLMVANLLFFFFMIKTRRFLNPKKIKSQSKAKLSSLFGSRLHGFKGSSAQEKSHDLQLASPREQDDLALEADRDDIAEKQI